MQILTLVIVAVIVVVFDVAGGGDFKCDGGTTLPTKGQGSARPNTCRLLFWIAILSESLLANEYIGSLSISNLDILKKPANVSTNVLLSSVFDISYNHRNKYYTFNLKYTSNAMIVLLYKYANK